MKRSAGFTVIELLVVVLFLAAASILFFVQKNNITVARQDEQRKTAINAMYYNLEEVFFKEKGYYPAKISSGNLPAMDPALFRDSSGRTVGEADSDYRYEPTNCTDEKCKGYTLRTILNNEADFIKTNR